MRKKILLNNNELNFSEYDLPSFIHGAHRAGSSLFTISLVAELYSQGSKLLFLSGFYMARDEFISQTEDYRNTFLLEDEGQIEEAQKQKAILVPRDNSVAFIKALKQLSDIDERVILVKNFDLFDISVFNAVKNKDKLILSGDIDKCSYKDAVLEKDWKMQIVFSKPSINLIFEFPSLEKYSGYMWTNDRKGEVRLKI